MGLLKEKASFKERKTSAQLIKSKILGFEETMIKGVSKAAKAGLLAY